MDFSVNPKIFKTYDIRGKVGEQLDTNAAFSVGSAFGTLIQRKYKIKRVFIGYDMRESSLDLLTKLSAGLQSTGCESHVIGLVSTPILYFKCAAQRLGRHYDYGESSR